MTAVDRLVENTEALKANTEALGFKRSIVRGFGQALGASLYLLLGAGVVSAILKAVGAI